MAERHGRELIEYLDACEQREAFARRLNEYIDHTVAALPWWKWVVYQTLVFCKVPKMEILSRL